MTLSDEIRALQLQLEAAHRQFGRLTDPRVVEISQRLDLRILEYYRRRTTR